MNVAFNTDLNWTVYILSRGLNVCPHLSNDNVSFLCSRNGSTESVSKTRNPARRAAVVPRGKILSLLHSNFPTYCEHFLHIQTYLIACLSTYLPTYQPACRHPLLPYPPFHPLTATIPSTSSVPLWLASLPPLLLHPSLPHHHNFSLLPSLLHQHSLLFQALPTFHILSFPHTSTSCLFYIILPNFIAASFLFSFLPSCVPAFLPFSFRTLVLYFPSYNLCILHNSWLIF